MRPTKIGGGASLDVGDAVFSAFRYAAYAYRLPPLF